MHIGINTINLPNVGKGVAEAESVELPVSVGAGVGPSRDLAEAMMVPTGWSSWT